MATTLLIASVGWYERRLLKAIGKSGADKIYLIKGTGGKIASVTNEFAKRIKHRLIHMDINIEEEADFDDHVSVYATYVNLIEKTLKDDKNARIIIDITSTTKDGAVAAFLVGQLYDIEISYVPELNKFTWMENMETKDIVARFDQDVAIDPGKECRLYKLKSLNIPESWKTALATVGESMGLSMGKTIDAVAKKVGERQRDRNAYQRYWGRVFHKLRDQGLVEIGKEEAGTVMLTLSEIGKAYVKGLKE